MAAPPRDSKVPCPSHRNVLGPKAYCGRHHTARRIAPSRSPLPGKPGWLVLLDALRDHHDGLDTVEPSGILPEQLALDRGGHLVPGHELQRLPAVLRIVMRIVRG